MVITLFPKSTMSDLTLHTASCKEHSDKSVCIYLSHCQALKEFEAKSQKRSKIPDSGIAGLSFDFSPGRLMAPKPLLLTSILCMSAEEDRLPGARWKGWRQKAKKNVSDNITT